MCAEEIQIKKASVKGEGEETDEDDQGWKGRRKKKRRDRKQIVSRLKVKTDTEG